MWANDFNEDDPENPRLADEYGIVMGTSHQEPMLRSQQEWDRRYFRTLGNWDYTKHPDTLENFWREGVRRNKNYESIITMGLRGANDSEMKGDMKSNIAMTVNLMKGLSYRANLGANLGLTQNNFFKSHYSAATGFGDPQAEKKEQIARGWTFENILSYNTKIDQHSIGVTLVQTNEKSIWEQTQATASKVPIESQLWNSLGSATTQSVNSDYSQWQLQSWLGRLNYSFKDRYLVTASMNSTSQKVSVLEKVGYSLGDLAANLVFQTLITYLAYFYTDIYGLKNTDASIIMLAVGLVAAFVFNPIIGALADRTKSRWGKFRPWILYTAIPLGVVAFLAFTTPNFSYKGKLIYAAITYTFLLLLYASSNLPYSALSGVLTGDMSERNSISSYRFIAVMFAQFFVQVFMLPIIEYAGHGDKAVGIEAVMGWLAIAGSVMLLITFFTTRERIIPTEEQKSTLKEDLSDLSKNKPWLIMPMEPICWLMH